MKEKFHPQKLKPRLQSKKSKFFINGWFIAGIILLVYITKEIISSPFINQKERINVVFYGRDTIFYSLGLADNLNYLIYFYPDIKVVVPGGYGRYRVGGIKKLVNLEKKPELFKKTFSLATSSFIDYYFYLPGDQVYYGNNLEKDDNFLPPVQSFFFSCSNARFFDRLYLFFNLITRKKSDFIRLKNQIEIVDQEKTISINDQAKTYFGFFYKKTYRNEKANVQIIYTKSDETAVSISNIIEGEGIRVVDFSFEKNKKTKENCQIIYKNTSVLKSARGLASFFNCQLTIGKPEISDIIFKLGKLEDEWAVN
ncbi:MAG: hypothetical protein QHH09_02250 [Microgenomates group bacterium]|nr:hypothetical protein [Microgenomates group bacterium]